MLAEAVARLALVAPVMVALPFVVVSHMLEASCRSHPGWVDTCLPIGPPSWDARELESNTDVFGEGEAECDAHFRRCWKMASMVRGWRECENRSSCCGKVWVSVGKGWALTRNCSSRASAR